MDQHGELIREVNILLSRCLQGHPFRWSSLLFEVNSVRPNRSLIFASGPAVSFAHGKHCGFASVSDISLDCKTLVFHASTCDLVLPTFSGYRVIVTACWHKASDALPSAMKSVLTNQGFVLDSNISLREPCFKCSALHAGGGESNMHEGLIDTHEHASHIIPFGTLDRSLIELCCSANSRLGADCPESAGCARYRFTEREDLTSASGVRLALEAVHDCQYRAKGNLLIWCSIPCTGGCTWNRINAKFPSAQAKLAAHRELFHKLWSACVRIMCYALATGGATLVIEWPRHCDYWGFAPVQSFLASQGLIRTHFDGCMYNMVGSCGALLKKPWSLASNTLFMSAALNLLCDNSHSHAQVRGVNAKRSEGYSSSIVSRTHGAFRDFCGKRLPVVLNPGGLASPALACCSAHPDALKPCWDFVSWEATLVCRDPSGLPHLRVHDDPCGEALLSPYTSSLNYSHECRSCVALVLLCIEFRVPIFGYISLRDGIL
mgnify:CR=1 FL=1